MPTPQGRRLLRRLSPELKKTTSVLVRVFGLGDRLKARRKRDPERLPGPNSRPAFLLRRFARLIPTQGLAIRRETTSRHVKRRNGKQGDPGQDQHHVGDRSLTSGGRKSIDHETADRRRKAYAKDVDAHDEHRHGGGPNPHWRQLLNGREGASVHHRQLEDPSADSQPENQTLAICHPIEKANGRKRDEDDHGQHRSPLPRRLQPPVAEKSAEDVSRHANRRVYQRNLQKERTDLKTQLFLPPDTVEL